MGTLGDTRYRLVIRRELRLRSDEGLPSARDGLIRLVILWQLREAHAERGGGSVPTAMLYDRVVEYVNVTVETFQSTLSRLVGERG